MALGLAAANLAACNGNVIVETDGSSTGVGGSTQSEDCDLYKDFQVAPTVAAPVNGEYPKTNFEVLETSDVAIDIRTMVGDVVEHIYVPVDGENGFGPGKYGVPWDGKDMELQSQFVPNGTYSIVLSAQTPECYQTDSADVTIANPEFLFDSQDFIETTASTGQSDVTCLNLVLTNNTDQEILVGFEVSLVIENNPSVEGGLLDTSTMPSTPNYENVAVRDDITTFTFPADVSTAPNASDVSQPLNLGGNVDLLPNVSHRIRVAFDTASNQAMVGDQVYCILHWPFKVNDTKGNPIAQSNVFPQSAIVGQTITIAQE